MRKLARYILLFGAIATLGSCKHQPSYVIDSDDMSLLLADIYTAEGVVELNHMHYNNDTSKFQLRQAVFERHGVTAQDFDTSLVWYAHNMDQYLKVYDRTLEILQEREKALGSAIVQTNVIIGGDSVDVWTSSPYAILSKRLPSNLISFEIEGDATNEPGDIYTWRLKVLDATPQRVCWNIIADYNDSTYDWLTSSTSRGDWNEMVFVSDSTKTIKRMRGNVEIVYYDDKSNNKATSQNDKWVDSISIIRKRINPDLYRQRFRIRQYKY